MISSRIKALRTNQTEAEKKLWGALRAKRFKELKFKRQVPFGRYIVDFACHEKKVIIEIDGGQHAVQHKDDSNRTLFLEKEGYRVLRFWNNEILENLEGVLDFLSRDLK